MKYKFLRIAFVSGNPFQPSLDCASKAGAYLSGVLLGANLLGRLKGLYLQHFVTYK